MLMTLKKYLSFSLLLSALMLVNPSLSMAQSKEEGTGFVDDSLKDISIVLGSAVGGAVLGLSTLSFVDEPSKHLKNISVGGAIGVVVGVGIVVFSQATKNTSAINGQAKTEIPLNSEKFETLTRHEFSDYRIAETRELVPHVGYSFSF